jgi:hypothetical protein
MPEMRVKAHMLRDRRVSPEQRSLLLSTSFDFQQGSDFIPDLISFVCNETNPQDGLVYVGLTSYDNDILYTFDPRTSQFRSLGFQAVAERFDVKVHRSLAIDRDGAVYGATACLHWVDQCMESPGGKLFCYQPGGEIEILGIPVPHQYIQTISLDPQRKILYGFTYPYAYFFRFDIPTRQARILAPVSYAPHTGVVDDDGVMWGMYQQINLGEGVPSRPSMLSYDPRSDQLTWHKGTFLPSAYPGDPGNNDCSLNAGDGFLYFGTTAGALVRFDPHSLEFKYLGRPGRGTRLPGLCLGRDGLLYACNGFDYDSHLVAYDREQERFWDFGRIYDPEIDAACFMPHHICEGPDGVFYIGESDNLDRSGYFWECRPER